MDYLAASRQRLSEDNRLPVLSLQTNSTVVNSETTFESTSQSHCNLQLIDLVLEVLNSVQSI